MRGRTFFTALALVVLACGCSSFKPGGETEGERLFSAKGCVRCHTVRPDKASGISLAKEGDKRAAEFLDAKLKDPKAGDAKAKMPRTKLTAKERFALVEYLTSLR